MLTVMGMAARSRGITLSQNQLGKKQTMQNALSHGNNQIRNVSKIPI
jgi:hypothetical protein